MAINCVTFNQDYSQVAIGTSKGFRVYTTDNFSKYHEATQSSISLLEPLFSTSLIATVVSPRRLIITNTKRNSTICELTFPTTVRSIRLNRKRLVVVLEDQIYLYDISNMKAVHTIDTAPNHHGIIALSPSSDRCYLAYPLPQKVAPSTLLPPSHVPPNSPHPAASGHMMMFDALSLQSINIVEAHLAPLSCIAMNNDGTKIATASEKGTIIRVFSVPEGHKLFQFRRGSTPSRIYSMSFNATSTLLCVSSATDTVHIFKLSTDGRTGSASPEAATARRMSFNSANSFNDDYNRPQSPTTDTSTRAHNGTFAGMIRRTSQNVSKTFAATVGSYLPSAVTEMMEPSRDFAWFKVPRSSSGTGTPVRCVVAMSSSSPQVMVATTEGTFFVFNIDLEKGGEGTLTKQYSLLDTGERPRPSLGEAQ